ncbi:MAG: hypothetical protein IKL18_06195 [Oscillospiraceae bacterium]|nr:hypothetical protein [Oscillospiraceae bacterium]
MAALPPFLCAIKEMGVNITITSVTKEAGRNFEKNPSTTFGGSPPFRQGRLI